MKKKLRKVFKKITPDNLDSILSDLGQQKGSVMQMQKPEKHVRLKELTVIAASLLLLVGVSAIGIRLVGSSPDVTPGTEPTKLQTVTNSESTVQTETTEAKQTLPEGVNLSENDAIMVAGEYNWPIFAFCYFKDEYKATVTLTQSDNREYETEKENGPVYVVQLQYGGYAYTYDISADRGEIWAETVERTDPGIALHWKTVRDIALEDAGVHILHLTYFEIKPDSCEDVKTYSVRFRNSPYQYAYTIDAHTGQILSKETEEVGYEADELLQKEGNLRRSAINGATLKADVAYGQLVYFEAEPVYNRERVDSYRVWLQQAEKSVEQYTQILRDYDDKSSSWSWW